MKRTRRNWLLAGMSLFLVLAGAGLYITATALTERFEPYIREQAIDYLRKRFDSDVQLEVLRIRLPNKSRLDLLLNRGRGARARVEGENILLRHKGRTDIAPMFAMKKFSFEVDLGAVFDEQKIVPLVTLDGMEITIPPKGDRPSFGATRWPGERPEQTVNPTKTPVVIREVRIRNARLTVLPRDRKKNPLEFHVHRAVLQSVGAGLAMDYHAELTNPKPPGEIRSEGTFGPWAAEVPGDTPIAGRYDFRKANLGVFQGIAGTLNSTGVFDGTLASINARGEASVPDFRLKKPGQRVPLKTRFEVLVDGTNGNTTLKPVRATLGSTEFTTSGGVIKHDGDVRRTVSLDVNMPKGNLRDLLTLAMKGPLFMEGKIALKTTVEVPPLSGKVREKLVLDGKFELSEAKFLKSTIQDQIDNLSRRGQGQPKNDGIDEVVSWMAGDFRLEDQTMMFRSLNFGVPGAAVDLAGNYDIDNDVLDFHGALRLQARMSQTQTGWKRWALRPVDPFFAKNGAGTFLRIQVVGSAKEPKFGLDKKKEPAAAK
ncbi:MAG: hypothetical protein ACREAM_02065 [Blastocatellia bacterium]